MICKLFRAFYLSVIISVEKYYSMFLPSSVWRRKPVCAVEYFDVDKSYILLPCRSFLRGILYARIWKKSDEAELKWKTWTDGNVRRHHVETHVCKIGEFPNWLEVIEPCNNIFM